MISRRRKGTVRYRLNSHSDRYTTITGERGSEPGRVIRRGHVRLTHN